MRLLMLTAAVAATAISVTACASRSQGIGQGVGTVPQTTPVSTSAPITSGPVTTPTLAPSSPASTSASLSPSVVIKAPPSSPLREVTVTSTDGKRKYDIKIWAEVRNTDCADHAYGAPVIQYLNAHPCAGLERLLATTSVNGEPVGFAQSSIGFVGNDPGVYQTAGDFASLERKNGTGSINDLLREGWRMPNGPSSLPSPDAFEVQSQDSAVTIVDAFYLDKKTPNNAPALMQMAQDIYLQF